MVEEAGFLGFEITWRKSIYDGAPQHSYADYYGTVGINFHAYKP